VGQAGLTLQDIDLFAVTTGPGTFTGLRVGLATVRALSQATGKPAVGIGTFDAIGGDEKTCILIETKRSDFYVRAPGQEDACCSPEDLAAILRPEWTLRGDAVDRAAYELKLNNPVKQVLSVPLENLVALAKKAPETGLPEPVYLRGADVSQTKKTPVNIV
jgi:tRNA threonylcarbamoyladenosine biosynthesis protein TsaB